jgi:hypothetical protein
MRTVWCWLGLLGVFLALASDQRVVAEDQVLAPIHDRFQTATTEEVPSFQKHLVPLFGRLGCNGRACHGSFQGQGGFRLSLFGYDFKSDLDALVASEKPRVNTEDPAQSLIITKPTDADFHEGGQRFALGSWEHHVILRWIEGGAKHDPADIKKLERLEIEPAEIRFSGTGPGRTQLRVVAVWADGVREDVTRLCRFKSNDELIAKVDADGLVVGEAKGDTHVIVAYDKAVVAVPAIRPMTELADSAYPDVPTPTPVDKLVVEKLRKLGIVPSDVASDAEFLRRVRLDMTGTLPSAEEVTKFLSDTDPDKRAKKVDELLETPAYAAWWTTQLCDFTGNNDQQLNNVSPLRNSASREWYDWIYKRVAENVTYDKIVEGILGGNNLQPGQSYREFCEEMSNLHRDPNRSSAELEYMNYYWARSDFRSIEARAIGFAYSFLGQRIQCAQCHKHPFDEWSKDDFHQFKNFFARIVPGRAAAVPREYRDEYNKLVKELGLDGKRGNDLRRDLPGLLEKGKTIPFPVTTLSPNLQRTPNPDEEYPHFTYGKLLGGDVVDVVKSEDPRKELMAWLRQSNNRFFAPAFVNRVWTAYFGVGIINPPDDISLGNPPSNRPLLDYLSQGFIESGFDMKWLHRTIANSRTYQLAWQPNETNALDERNFSHAIPRRMPAEVAYDAIQFATSSSTRVSQLLTSNQGRAIAIPGSGNRNNNNDQAFALTVFGRSTRESNCDCDRSSEPTLLQTVFLQNDNAMLQLLNGNRGSWLDEVSDELGRKTEAVAAERPNGPRRGPALKAQIEFLQARIEKLKENNNPRALAAAKERLAALKKQYRAMNGDTDAEESDDATAGAEKPEKKKAEANDNPAEKPAAEAQPVVRDTKQYDSYITQAYLRTVSRYPSDEELQRTREHLASADNPVDGLRDVLWALLNTKEFIVNH